LSIRNAEFNDCNDLGLTIVTASLATFLGRIPEQCLDFSWTPAVSAANWRRGFHEISQSDRHFFVFEVNSKVIGYLLASPGAFSDGYQWSVDELYVLPSHQSSGVGRALLSRLARELLRSGITSLEIGCVKENPSCGFYLHLGGNRLGTRAANVDAYKTEEILFGWPDLSVLV
jgi:L-amino acid N-acyltransferase YncA